jgi:hypothetical protein
MKRFLLGLFIGVLGVAAVFAFLPDRAHTLVDQAGDFRAMLEDVAARIENLESEPAGESVLDVVLPATPTERLLAAGWTEAELARTTNIIELDAAEEPLSSATAPAPPAPNAVERQAVDFSNLAAGLARVSGALERLNRTMRPSHRAKPKPDSDNATDASL